MPENTAFLQTINCAASVYASGAANGITAETVYGRHTGGAECIRI